MKIVMKKSLKESVSFVLAVVLGLVALWFVLSLSWSSAEMGVCEKVAGVLYLAVMVPVYVWVCRALGVER